VAGVAKQRDPPGGQPPGRGAPCPSRRAEHAP